MKSLILILPAMAILGYLAGSQVHSRFISIESDPASDSRPEERPASLGSAPILSLLRSDDSIETLASVPAPELYDRLALWLLDADPAGIQEFWQSYLQRSDRAEELNELIFVNWIRIDRSSAFAAAAGTEFEKYPWWAWTCHEPEQALAAVLAFHSDQADHENIGWVMRGLGEFHPAWLRDHSNDIPEKWRSRALTGYQQWADTENPRESVEFLRKHGGVIDSKTLAALGRDTPIEAYELALELAKGPKDWLYRGATSDLLSSLAADNPSHLQSLEDHIKAPAELAQVKLLRFQDILKTDQEAAEKIAESSAGWLRQDQLAELGELFLKSDPGKALELVGKILASGGNPYARMSSMQHPHGSSLHYLDGVPRRRNLSARSSRPILTVFWTIFSCLMENRARYLKLSEPSLQKLTLRTMPLG